METLLVVAIIVTALAVVVQAGSLLAMYLLSRRVVDHVNELVSEGQKLMGPLERVSANLQTSSEDLIAISRQSRDEMQRIHAILAETQTAVRGEIDELRTRFNYTVDEVQARILTPVREWSAMAAGITAGVRTFFSRRC